MKSLSQWTKPDVDAQCVAAHGRYDRALALHYTKYFAQHTELRGERPYCASSLEAALPTQWNVLARRLPTNRRHQHYLSGKSSQVLALGLLGAAAELDPSHRWLSQLLDCRWNGIVSSEFEYTLDPRILGEQLGRVTSIDYLVAGDEMFVCLETKWREEGLGACSCGRSSDADDEADPTVGECSERVLRRAAYWDTSHDIFKLPDRSPPKYCPISTSYQAVRNVAAARLLSAGRPFAFILIYDDRNPYFGETNDWPGWPALLRSALLDDGMFRFRAVSWQHLVTMLPLDESVKVWAREKHQLQI